MHIPDGALCPYNCIEAFAAATPLWAIAMRKFREKLDFKKLPAMAVGTVFSFLIMMIDVPIPGGTTGHALGSTILSLTLGPWISSILISLVLLVQAVFLHDGGITTYAANCLLMAFVPSFASYYLFKSLNKDNSKDLIKKALFAGFAGYLSVSFAALIAGILLGIQSGHANPAYVLSISIPAMYLKHIFLFGWVEALVTFFAFRLLDRIQFLIPVKEKIQISK